VIFFVCAAHCSRLAGPRESLDQQEETHQDDEGTARLLQSLQAQSKTPGSRRTTARGRWAVGPKGIHIINDIIPFVLWYHRSVICQYTDIMDGSRWYHTQYHVRYQSTFRQILVMMSLCSDILKHFYDILGHWYTKIRISWMAEHDIIFDIIVDIREQCLSTFH
jgi:hypothetical protein